MTVRDEIAEEERLLAAREALADERAAMDEALVEFQAEREVRP